jgi:hypothetical protein
MNITDFEFQKLIKPLIGQSICRKQVGFRRSLSIGFGNKISHSNQKTRDDYYGEWEIGTYNCAWRIVKDKKVLCGSHDPADSIKEIDSSLQRIELGCILSLDRRGQADFYFQLENNMAIEFFFATSEENEVMHVFCPSNRYLEFIVDQGWQMKNSEQGKEIQSAIFD